MKSHQTKKRVRQIEDGQKEQLDSIPSILEDIQNLEDDPDYDEYIGLKSNGSIKENPSREQQEDPQKQHHIVDDGIDEADQKESKDGGSSSFASNPENSFFYTQDKFFNAFEDDEIVVDIQQKYPMFKDIDTDDTIMRKTIIDLLNDSKFMVKLLKHYNITIFDFIKFLFRQEPSLFKGQFVKRIGKALKYKKYVSQDKKQAFRYSAKHRKNIRRKKS